METYQALLLGTIQGLTEFLPVSSSGHLALGQYSFGITVPTLFFDISLHIGTLAAVIMVFFDDIKAMFTAFINMTQTLLRLDLNEFRHYIKKDPEIRFVFMIIVGSIPTAMIGLFLKHYIDNLFESINFVGTMLIITGTFLWLTRGFNKEDRYEQNLKSDDLQTEPIKKTDTQIMTFGYKQALLIGVCQGVAVVPGISRSGATIAAALFSGIDRENAAKFSFLLSIPAIVGAELLGLKDLLGSGINPDISTLWGTIIAFITGYVALKVLLKIVRVGKLHLFAPYCWILGVIAVVAGVL